MIPEYMNIKGGPDAPHTYEDVGGKPFSPSSGSAANCEARNHNIQRYLLGVVLPYATMRCKCHTCGHEWSESYKRRAKVYEAKPSNCSSATER